jgi:hypothetical protein
VSWSIDGSIRRPIEVSALLQHTRAVLRELLATDEVPELSSNAPMVTIETTGTDIAFTVCLPTGDGAEVDTLELLDHSSDQDAETMFVTVTSRYRVEITCVSVVLCIAIALAAADLGGGAFFDENRGIVWPLIYDPREVIAKTGLAPGDLGFLDRCERYLRQFEHLDGWPRTVTPAG